MLNLFGTFLTYLFLLIKLIIVSFIVIYVINKIYICIFDNKPFPPPPEPMPALNAATFEKKCKKSNRKKLSIRLARTDSTLVVLSSKQLGKKLNARTKPRSSIIQRGSKSTLDQSLNGIRITLTLRPSYLISVRLDNCKWLLNRCTADVGKGDQCALKYYDKLCSVPRLKVLLRSLDQAESIRQRLDNVMLDVTAKPYMAFELAKRKYLTDV